ncbi:MAG: Ku protein, partial [Polyangiaceae bacterium]
EKHGQKAYKLLLETLEKTNRAGIAQVVLRTRQHLAALVPHGDVLVLLMMRYAHELRSSKEIDHPDAKKATVSAAERKMAQQLVEGMSGPFKADEFQDTYYDDVMALVNKKVKSGKPTAITHPKSPKQKFAKVVDLADLLAKSLARKKHHKKSA